MTAPVRIGLPSSFGWVRDPSRDTGPLEAWELPSGEIRYTAKGLRFCVVRDAGGTRIKPMMTKAGSKD